MSFKSGFSDVKPIGNFNFVLRVEGFWEVPCKSVRAIHKENEYDYIQEGGVNDYVHIIRKPITKPFTLQVERYVGDRFYDPLSLGTRLVLPLLLSVGRYTDPDVPFVCDRMYIFTGCEVTAKDFGELNSERSGLLTETLTITFESMFTMDSMTDFKKDTWKFDGTKKEGNSEFHRRNSDSNHEDTKEEMMSRTQRWSMAQSHGGNETRTDPSISSRQNLLLSGDLDKSVSDMTEAGVRWNFNGKDIKGTYSGSGSRQTKTTDPSETRKAEMIDKQVKWEFEGKSKAGKYVGSETEKTKKTLPTEPKQSDMINAGVRWNFNGKDMNGTYTGTGSNQTKITDPSETRKAEMAGNHVQWQFNGNSKEGTFVGNTTKLERDKIIQEEDKSTMEGKARLWPPTRSSKDIADFLSNPKG